LPVVHITRRKPWEEVKDAEQDLPDLAPVTAPAPNRSGELSLDHSIAVTVLILLVSACRSVLRVSPPKDSEPHETQSIKALFTAELRCFIKVADLGLDVSSSKTMADDWRLVVPCS
jgi:hypothetical protein